jgi:hypothetical protein
MKIKLNNMKIKLRILKYSVVLKNRYYVKEWIFIKRNVKMLECYIKDLYWKEILKWMLC